MIEGVIVKKLEKFGDDRGWLTEIYRSDEIDFKPEMSYVSMTNPGIARGPHEHEHQSDGFVFIGPGNMRLYLWDNRENSKTYKKHGSLNVGKDNPVMVIIPPGVVHGYKCISKNPAWCINLPNKLYMGHGKKEEIDEIRWENKKNSLFKI
ncbi:dTDP-4-dehydrorhamnose 3,5-epimerase family protein [Patescibacteria group bacterium]